MGRYLDIIKQREHENGEFRDVLPSPDNGLLNSLVSKQNNESTVSTKETNLTKKGCHLERRLLKHSLAIAIDMATNQALLLFRPEDAETVRNVASVYQPFEITLTEDQRTELEADLDYWEAINRRKNFDGSEKQ